MTTASSAPLKVVAFITAFIFCFNQVVFASGEILTQEYFASNPTPTQAVSETPKTTSSSNTLPASTSTDFLAQTLTLQPSATETTPPETVSYNPSLTAADVTTVPGTPYPYIKDGSSAATSLSYTASTTRTVLKYDVTNSGDTSGFTVSFDNASTAMIETANLSTLASLTFGLKGTAVSATLEVVDSLGNKSSFLLSNITSSTERFWTIPLTSIASAVDQAKIKELNFIVAQADTNITSRTGTLSIRLKGLKTTAPVVPALTSGGSLVTDQAVFVLSGTKEANTAILINGVEVVARDSSTTWSATVSLPVEGSNAFKIKAKNSIGLLSTVLTATVKKDTVKPTGTVNINSSALYTSSQTVTLNLSGADASSGISTMSFSTDNTNWTTPVAYATSKTFTLPAGDGQKTVYVKYYDKAGNESVVYSKSILLDTTQPSGTVLINSGANYATSTSVTLALLGADSGSGIAKMSFSTNGTTWTTAEAYATSKALTLPSGNGVKTVYVRYYDKAGNISQSFSDTIILDTVAPTGTIKVNGGATYINQATVTLNLAATDAGSGLANMSFSSDNVNWTAVEAYAATKDWIFAVGDGTKTVYVKYYDKAGNESVVYSKSIILDTLPPAGIVTVNGGAQYINQTAVTLNLSAADTGSGISKMSFSRNGTTWTTAEAYALTKAWTFAAGDGNKIVYAKFQDKSGKWSTPVSVTVTMDTVKPSGAISINSGATETDSTEVTLNLLATDSGSGISTMSFSTDNTSWTEPETFAASRAFTLPAGDGLKTVCVRFFDKAGNVSAVFSKNITVATAAPVIVISPEMPVLINHKTLTVDYTSDGVAKQKTFTDLLEGENILSITEVNEYGKGTTMTCKVVVDTTAPVVVLDFATPSLINVKTLAVNYTLEGVAKEKTFTGLAEGLNHLTITETDLAGNSTVKTFDVTVDTIAPAVVVDPSPPSLINVKALTVNYTLEGVAKTKTFTGLAEGLNHLTITETDLAGNTTVKSFDVTVDTIAPVVVIDPSTPSLINVKALTVNYTLDTVAKTKTFTGLAEGLNHLTITETDLAGNSTVKAFDVTVDTIAPIVATTSTIPALTDNSVLNVTYTADGVAKSKVFNLVEGNNTGLTITETDEIGNTSTFPLQPVVLDTQAPELGLLSDAYVYSPNYTLKYRVSDTSLTTSVQQENVTLQRGWNTFTRQATDALGHTREMTWKVFLDQNAERGQNTDYDANGNVIRTTDFNGQDTTYEYDALNRLAKVTYPEGTSVSYTYDAVGNVSQMNDSRGATKYFYDIANRLSSIQFPDGKTIYYDLDASGQLIRLRYAGRAIEYGYDAAGRLTSVKDGSDITAYTYNDAGDLVSTTLPNGIRTTNTYDAAGRLIDILHENISGENPVLVARFHYTLDAAGQRTQMIETRPGSVRTVDYTYDEFGRLTQDVDSAYGTTKYAYDAAGNRISMERIPNVISAGTPRIVNQYTYGVDNRLLSMTETHFNASATQISSMTETYAYDAAGRMLQKITPTRVTYYEYDSRGLLIRVNDGVNESTYEYDGLGNRIAKTVNGVKTKYMVDIASTVPQVLAEMDGTGAVEQSYIYGMDRISTDNVATSTNSYFLQDGLGSSIGLTDASGLVTDSYSYNAFGNSISPQHLVLNTSFKYAGEQVDTETGLVYLRARYYDPQLGRFISRDPQYIGDSSQTQSYNPFIYVQDDPVNLVDPLGLDAFFMKGKLFNVIPIINNSTLDKRNAEVSHEHIWFDHEHYIKGVGMTDNVGFGSDGKLFRYTNRDAIKQFSNKSSPYNEDIMVEAINSTPTGKYSLLGLDNFWLAPFAAPLLAILNPPKNNCQDWSERVRDQYNELLNDSNEELFDNYLLEDPFDDFSDEYIFGNDSGGGGGGFLGDIWSGMGDAFNSLTDLFRGGVYMDKALDVIGDNIKDIQGVSYDPVTGQIIMLSETGANVPEVPVDYFLAALKAVFGESQSAPGVSIDPQRDANGNVITTQDQTVRFLGGIENTALGKAVFDADLLMKLIGAGKDNVTGTAVRANGENISEAYIASHIPGFKDLFTLSSEVSDPNLLNGSANMRFWFTPKEMSLVRSDAGDAFVFQENSVQLLTENMFFTSTEGTSTGVEDPRAAAFAQFFNAHFSELAALYPEFSELEKGMRAVGLAKFIKDNNIPVDLDWLSKADLTPVTTLATTPLLTTERTVTHQGTGRQVTITLMGGVDYNLFDGKNFQYVLDSENQAAGLKNAAQAARTDDLETTWQVDLGGKTYEAIALSLSPTKKDGSFSWQNTDLSYGTSGDFGLTFERYYDSFLADEKTDLGYGWHDIPYELGFPVADESIVFGSGADQPTVNIPPKILFTDWASHQLLEFTPYQRQTNGAIIYSPQDGKISRELFVLNSDGTYIYRRDGKEIYFTAEGILTQLKDRNGNQITYSYDAQGKLLRIKDESSGHEIVLTYNANGRVTQASGSDGRTISYGYDFSGNLKTVKRDWLNRTTTFEYNLDHQLVKTIDYAGRTLFENSFDEIGRLTSQTNFLGNESTSDPNLLLQKTMATNSVTGAASAATYNQNFQVTSQTNALGNQVTYKYDENNLFGPVSATDAEGNTTYFSYDQFGNLIQVTDVFWNKTKYYYTAIAGDNRIIFVENANGRGTGYDYDNRGNLTDVYEGARILDVGPTGDITFEATSIHTHYNYDAQGRVIAALSPDGNAVYYTYDAAGHVIQATDSLGHSATTAYIERNGVLTDLVSSVTDALGRTVQYIYDSAKDLVTSIITTAGTIHLGYDNLDRLTSAQDENDRKTEWIYNEKDQLISTVNQNSAETNSIPMHYSYDELGRTTAIAGPLGATTNFAYDLLGRVKNLSISESGKSYATAQGVKIENAGQDKVTLSFNVESNVGSVKVLYKKSSDSTYQVMTVSNLVTGDNQVTIQGLSNNTTYDFQLEYKDRENDLSYSRKYQAKTGMPEQPVILRAVLSNVADTTADIKINVDKEIQSARITYHVRGETVNKTVLTQSVQSANTDGLTFNLENLRSGLDYDAEITITDRFGVTSEVKTMSFKTTGALSSQDTALHAVQGFGGVFVTLTDQAYISLEDSRIANPLAEQYDIRVWNSVGNPISFSWGTGTVGPLSDRVLAILGLSANSLYAYTLTVTSRGDILPVFGTFWTAPGNDTTSPNTLGFSMMAKDPYTRLFVITPTENLRVIEVTMTDTVTLAVKRYYFFNLAANVTQTLLLDGLQPGRTYTQKWLMLDMSGYYSIQPFNINVVMPSLDETPPIMTQNTLVERTLMTAKLHVVTNEILKKLKVRYRIAGTEEWLEQVIVPTGTSFDINLSGLVSGQSYEYQYILEDQSLNQTVTEWTRL